jgi:vesicle-associated membrane protein 7
MPIKYSCINNGAELVSEYPAEEQPKLAATLKSVIDSVPPKEYRRQTVEDADVNYHYISNGDGRIVGCASTKDVKTRVVFNFLDAVESLVRGPNADLRNAKKVLKQKMEFHNDPANDKITAVQDSIDKAKDIMTDNVDKALARGDRVDTLHAKSVTLQEQALTFQTKSTQLKRSLCMRNAKFAAMIAFAVVVLILILVMVICKPNFRDCKSDD